MAPRSNVRIGGFFDEVSWQPLPVLRSDSPQCGRCGLKRQRELQTPQMSPTGKGKRRVLFVGEAPGQTEDEQGEQFVGKAGSLLRRVLRRLEVDLDDCWKTNAVACRPPKNKIDPVYVSCCEPLLLRTVRDLKPNVIIALGASAVRSLLSPEWKQHLGAISRWVGWTIPSQHHRAWVCPTYHPSYILRMNEDEVLLRAFTDHLRVALRLEKKAVPLVAIDDHIEIVESRKESLRRMRDLARAKGWLAFDYETTGLKPDAKGHQILSCAFCLNGERAWACRVTPNEYLMLRAIICNRHTRKIASNLKYEERWSRALLGAGVRNWGWDTMLAAHWLDNRREICSIKFQAYVHLGVVGWESVAEPYKWAKSSNGQNRFADMTTGDLLRYNAIDAWTEYSVAMRQRRALADTAG